MTIRPLTKADEPFLWEMLYHALYVPEGHEPFPLTIVTNPELARYVVDWGRATDSGFAVVDQAFKQPVGAVWMRLFTRESPGYGYVADSFPELSMAILPDYRARGLGTSLLNKVFEEAQKRYSGLSLSVSSDNPARRLYERMGFEIIARLDNSLTMIKKF